MSFSCVWAVRECTGCGRCFPAGRMPRCDGCGRSLAAVDSMEVDGRVWCDECLRALVGAEDEEP